jgi:hypothetical protein
MFGRKLGHEIIDLGDMVLIRGNPYSGWGRRYTAGEALAQGDVVYISAAGVVSKATNSYRSQTIGVAIEAADLNATVTVLHFGRASVIADAAISVGDPVAAAATAGRVISLLSHSHGFTPAGSISSVSAGTPSGTISSTDLGNKTSDPPTATITVASDPGGWGTLYAASASGGSNTTAFKAAQSSNYLSVASSGHQHVVAIGSHGHTFTGSALPTHGHMFTGSAGTTDSAGSAQILGKALAAAAGAGSSLDILVCLAG